MFLSSHISKAILFSFERGKDMITDAEIIGRYDSYIKKSLKNELRTGIRLAKMYHSRVVNFSEMSKSDENKLVKNDQYNFCYFKEKFDTRTFDVLIRDELLYEALCSINSKARIIILLKFWVGLSDQEIGQVLRMNRVSVTKNKNKTLIMLKNIMEELRKNDT